MIYDGITRTQVRHLSRTSGNPAVSIFVSTARSGSDVLQGRIKLKNLLVQAEEMLVDGGMRRTLAIDFLAPVSKCDTDPEFWNERFDGVAFFLTSEMFECFHLPFATPEFLHVGRAFYIRPLVSMLNQCPEWDVLALDKNRVRLVRCGLHSARETLVEGMPTSIEAFVSSEHAEKRLQYHSAGPANRAGSVIAHGTGDKGVNEKDRLNRFSLAIARAVESHLKSSRGPVVLAGTAEFQDSFRSVTKLPQVLGEAITRSPKTLDNSDLRTESMPIIRAYSERPRQAALAHYAEMAGTGLTSDQLDEILAAGSAGRIDVLFTRGEPVVWGEIGAGVALHEERHPGDEELLNAAVISTIENSGTVFEFQPGELQTREPAAAVFRF